MSVNTAEARLESLRILFEWNTKKLFPLYPPNYFPGVMGEHTFAILLSDNN